MQKIFVNNNGNSYASARLLILGRQDFMVDPYRNRQDTIKM